MRNYIELKNVKDVKGWIGTEMTTTEKFIRELMANVALVIMDKAKRRAPVITGRYRSSIHIEWGTDTQVQAMRGTNLITTKKGTEKDDSKFTDSPEPGTIFVGTNVVYAQNVENKHRTMEDATTEGQWYLTRKLNKAK